MSRHTRRKKRAARKQFIEETQDKLMRMPSGTIRKTRDGDYEVFIPHHGWQRIMSATEMVKELGKPLVTSMQATCSKKDSNS